MGKARTEIMIQGQTQEREREREYKSGVRQIKMYLLHRLAVQCLK